MKHLTEDILIQYAFDLLDSEARHAAKAHLDDCVQCREQLEQIQLTFSALDTLDKDEILPESLIRQTIQTPAPRANRSMIRRWAAVITAAAAAILVVGVVFLRPQTARIAPPTSQEPQVSNKPEKINRLARVSRETDSTIKLELDSPTQELTAHTDSPAANARIVTAESIPDKPPFAPASAIELIVLPRPDATQLTIYNSADLTFIRDTRKLTLKPGWNWLQFMWNGTLIDPTSLSLRPLQQADHIDVQLLSYPAGLKDIGRWLIRSEVEGAVPFEITYFASGLSWRAFYMATMNNDETTMNLKGYVNVSNHSGQDFTNAQTRLVVGQTRLTETIRELAARQYPYGPEVIEEKFTTYDFRGIPEKERLTGELPVLGRMFTNSDSDVSAGITIENRIKEIAKEGLSEYFLYTIEGTEDLPDTWSKRLPSMDIADIPVTSLYKYDENRYGKQTVRFVSFANDTEHQLGQTPLPQGSIRLYRTVNDRQNLSYIGKSTIKYIPVNEDVQLNLGPASRVTVTPTLMDTQTDHYTFDSNGQISGWDEIETWQMNVTNTRSINAEIEITRDFGTESWQIIPPTDNPSVTYTQHDKQRARFTLTVPPQTETMFTYTVTKYQGRRVEIYTQQLQEQSK